MPRGKFDMHIDQEREVYEAGMAHFNNGDFFEAHSIWEDAWNGTSGRRSEFYRGLVQMAVALEHYNRRNGLGVRRVYEMARRQWAFLPDVYMGLDLRAFQQKMETTLREALMAPDGTPISTRLLDSMNIQWLYDPFKDPREEKDD